MRYISLILFSLFIVSMTACSAKIQEKQNIIINNDLKSDKEVEEDVFLDDFSDELQVERKADPLNGYNRIMTDFNDSTYEYVLSPLARGYKTVVHKEIRTSVDNFFHNILFPVRFVNNLLQGKFINTAEETSRFLINSTFGVLGLFDPAKRHFNLNKHNEDFGQTLGFYGVSAGPHIVLPLLGPSNLRDAISLYPDMLLNPVAYNESRSYNLASGYEESHLLRLYERENFISLHHQEYDKIKQDAIDLYPFLRDIYEQRRMNLIKE